MTYYNTGTPSGMPLIIAPNMLPYFTLATSSDMTTSIPNPSSQIATMPGTNFIDPLRHRIYRSRGCFRIYTATNKGYVFAPNTKLYIDEGGGEQTATFTEGTYQDPETLAAHMQTTINAVAGLSADYTVSYDDRRDSGDSATFKWTISRAGGNFTMNVVGKTDDILESLGFSSAANYSGASTYTSDNKACHTEEYIILKWPVNLQAIWHSEGDYSLASFFTWMALLDSNIRFGNASGFASGGPKQMPKFYLYGTGTVEFDDDPTTHTEGTDLFTFPGNAVGNFPSYIGIDSPLYAGRSVTTDVHLQRTVLIDFADWTNSFTWVQNKGYLKLVISDPQHPDGYVQLGTCPNGPGWYPRAGYNFPSQWTMQDLTQVGYTAGGSRWARTQGAMRRVCRLSFNRSGITDGTVDASTALWGDASYAQFLHRIYGRMMQDVTTSKTTLFAIDKPDKAAAGKGRIPFLFVDRSWNPVLGNANRTTQGSSCYNIHNHAASTMYCTVGEDPTWNRQFDNRWGFDLELVEEL